MQSISKSEIYLRVIAWTVLILGVAMVVYWIMFLVKRMPIGDIPVLSESITSMFSSYNRIRIIVSKTLVGALLFGISGYVGI